MPMKPGGGEAAMAGEEEAETAQVHGLR